jgi:hypothetical protein
MEDLNFLERLDCGDHEFVPGAERLKLGIVTVPPGIPDQGHVRWDRLFMYTEPGSWGQEEGVMGAGAFGWGREPWANGRPDWIYSLGVESLLFVERSGRPEYAVFGARRGTEAGGEMESLPSGFLNRNDMRYTNPVQRGIRREGSAALAEPIIKRESGVIRSDSRSGLTACCEVSVEAWKLERKFALEERADGVVSVKRRHPRLHRPAKYGEILMVPVGTLDRYVHDNLERYGGRRFGDVTSLILKRYFERA